MKPMKKKFLSILLAAVMVLSLIPAFALSVSADPVVYEVANETELIAALEAHNSSKDRSEIIRLTGDIIIDDLDTWMTTIWYNDHGYIYGTFDGQNHTIYNFQNLTKTIGGKSYTMNSFIWPNGNCLIKDFTISNKTASDGSKFTLSGTSAIFGNNITTSEIKAGETAIIRNVKNERCLSGSSNATGVFFNSLTIAGTVRFENCINNGDYKQSADPSVDNALYNNNHKIGGFVGSMKSGTVEFVGCTNNGNVNASQAGGFIGVYGNDGAAITITMQNCTNTGDITGLSKAGGACGVAGGLIGGYNNVTAISGNVAVTLTNCVNTGNITVAYPSGTYNANAIGGLIGHAGGSADGKTCTITLNNCGVYGCTITTNGADEYAAPLVGKCSPVSRDNYTVTANSCYVSRVNVIGGTARKLIGVGSADNSTRPNAYNCVLNDVTENGSEEWNGSKYSNLNVALSSTNYFVDTDTANAISDGLAPAYQLAAAAADTTKVRFLATLKDGALTAYEKVGFFVTASYSTTVKGWNLNSTTVYSSVVAAGVDTNASAIYDGHGSEAYIFVATLEGINIPPQDVTFNVTPYVVNTDGSVLFGLTGQFEISVGSL